MAKDKPDVFLPSVLKPASRGYNGEHTGQWRHKVATAVGIGAVCAGVGLDIYGKSQIDDGTQALDALSQKPAAPAAMEQKIKAASTTIKKGRTNERWGDGLVVGGALLGAAGVAAGRRGRD